jgi:hypothetical protein
MYVLMNRCTTLILSNTTIYENYSPYMLCLLAATLYCIPWHFSETICGLKKTKIPVGGVKHEITINQSLQYLQF